MADLCSGGRMKKTILWLLLLSLFCLTGIAAAQTSVPTQTPAPTQTPYIIYVVVTATPEPAAVQPADTPAAEAPVILRPNETESISLVNDGSGTGGQTGSEITIANQASYAETVDELIRRVVSTVTADTNAANTTAGGTQNYSGTGGTAVRLSDGTTCTMNFQLVSEPTYPAGSIIPRGEVFWKEWLIQNTGTCTWTPEWEFVFDSGWQIGNTRFHMNRTTAPGETLNVRLAMVPDQREDGNYYSTYIFEAPDGTRYGTITSSYTVKPASYFAKPTPAPKNKPPYGRPPSPWDCPPGPWSVCPPPPPPWCW